MKKVKAVTYLEERLFMLESLIEAITYDQALQFLKIMSELLDMKVSGRNGPGGVEAEIEKKVSSCFLTYSVNPIKACVMLINCVHQIQKKFEMLYFKTSELQEKIIEMGNAIIEE